MRTTSWMVAALLLVLPALAQAKGKGEWTPLGKNDKLIRRLVANELNARKIGIGGNSHYTMTSVKGEKRLLGSSQFGRTTEVKFTAQPKVKVTYSDGTKSWIKLGGVAGTCKVGSVMCRPPGILKSSFKVTSLLRSLRSGL